MTQPTTDKARARLAAFLGYEPDEHDALFESHLDAYRAAVLREAADVAERENADCPVTAAGRPCPPCAARAAVATKLRRMAEEDRS
jgi:hypothetical protein